MDRIERIRQMEALLDECSTAVSDFGAALEKYRAAQDRIAALSKYYGSRSWHADRRADERGLLPEDERNYLTLTYDRTDDVDYYIVCRDDKPDTGIGQPGYDKVFSVTVDSDEIGAVYKRMTSGEE